MSVLARIGLSYKERLYGAHFRDDMPSVQMPIAVTLDAHGSLWSSLRRWAIDVSGEIRASELCERSPVSGIINLTFLGPAPRISYALDFEDDRGERLLLSAEKLVDGRDLYASLTVLNGRITDRGGKTRARCLMRFDARGDLGTYWKSFRVHLERGREPS